MTAPKPDYASEPPWRQRGFIMAAVFIVLLIVTALVIALVPNPAANAPRSTGSPSPSKPAAGDPSTGASPAPDATLPTTPPTTAPQAVTWRLLGQTPLPYSETDGPRTVTDTTASGYAHTPVGALIAAQQLSARAGLSAGKTVYEPTITNQYVAGPDRDRMLDALRMADQTPAAPGELSQLIGFTYQAYSTDTAVIGLVRRAPSAEPRYFISTVTLQWRDNDWRMVAPPGGSWLSISREAKNLIGVVEWGAR